MSSVENMVHQQGLNGSRIVPGKSGTGRAVHELGEGSIRRSKNGDILGGLEGGQDLREEADIGGQVGKVCGVSQDTLERLRRGRGSQCCKREEFVLHVDKYERRESSKTFNVG